MTLLDRQLASTISRAQYENQEKYTDLWLIRHCQSIQMQAGLLQQDDTELSPLGMRQADRLAQHLRTTCNCEVLYSSPLKRAQETATCIAEAVGLRTIVVNELREIDNGCAGGLSLDEFRQTWPGLSAMRDDPLNVDFQWPDGENREEFHRRSLSAIDTLVQDHCGDSILVVAHTGNLCGYLAHLFLNNSLRWREYHLQPGSVSRVKLYFDESPQLSIKTARLLSFNDVSHLQSLE